MHFELSPLIVWIALWIVNPYSQFQEIIFSNNRHISKCRSFSTTTTLIKYWWQWWQRQCQVYSNTSCFLRKQPSYTCVHDTIFYYLGCTLWLSGKTSKLIALTFICSTLNKYKNHTKCKKTAKPSIFHVFYVCVQFSIDQGQKIKVFLCQVHGLYDPFKTVTYKCKCSGIINHQNHFLLLPFRQLDLYPAVTDLPIVLWKV